MEKIVFITGFQILLQRQGQAACLHCLESALRFCSRSFSQMMQFAWQSYKRYAMGKNELRPLTKDGYEGSMFGELAPETPAPGGQAEFHFRLLAS